MSSKLKLTISWTREGHSNNFLYNEGTELNQTSGWYETMFRGYDATLGRFLQVDPKAGSYESWLPYNYAFNNPVFWNDPTGADADFGEFLEDLYRNTKGSKHYSGNEIRDMYDKYMESDGLVLNWGDYGTEIWVDQESDGSYSFSYFVEASLDYSTANKNTGPTTELRLVTVRVNGSQAQQGDPDFGLGERAPNSAYTERANTIGVADLFFEFITGTGTERSLFTENHPMTRELRESYIVSFARVQFALGRSKPMIREDIPFGVVVAALTGGNLTSQFVGGARISIIPTAAGNVFIVDNTTGRHSFEAHRNPDIPRHPTIMTPEGNIYQRFIWIER